MDNNNDIEQELYVYQIPQNIIKSKRYFGFRGRNIIEALIWAAVFFFIIYLIPFVTRVKIIFTVVLCVSVAVVNLIGIKDLSISELVINFCQSQKDKGIYHLRSIKYESRKQKNYKDQNEYLTGYGESAADKTFAFAKEKIRQFKEPK